MRFFSGPELVVVVVVVRLGAGDLCPTRRRRWWFCRRSKRRRGQRALCRERRRCRERHLVPELDARASDPASGRARLGGESRRKGRSQRARRQKRWQRQPLVADGAGWSPRVCPCCLLLLPSSFSTSCSSDSRRQQERRHHRQRGGPLPSDGRGLDDRCCPGQKAPEARGRSGAAAPRRARGESSGGDAQLGSDGVPAVSGGREREGLWSVPGGIPCSSGCFLFFFFPFSCSFFGGSSNSSSSSSSSWPPYASAQRAAARARGPSSPKDSEPRRPRSKPAPRPPLPRYFIRCSFVRRSGRICCGCSVRGTLGQAAGTCRTPAAATAAAAAAAAGAGGDGSEQLLAPVFF